MARLVLIAILLVQLAFALAVGWAVLSWRPQMGPWGAAALALGLVVLVRLAISVNNFRMAARAASATPAEHALAWRGALRLFWQEFSSSMLATSWHMLYPNRGLHLGSGVPVLLLHGYGCNSGYWVHLSACLRRDGISHAALDLEPIAGSIDSYADSIEHALLRLCKAAGTRQAVIVAHSMGGLAARAYLRRYGAARVARVITLGTPHHGTVLANFGPGENARQMRHGSPWLAALAASETSEIRALFVSVWSHHDNIIAPQNSSFLPGARNIAFGGIGHVALGADARILRTVLDEIAAIPA
jgi:triacylglycerol esterase/lipase EstA (alpha/beta hydrolase family)